MNEETGHHEKGSSEDKLSAPVLAIISNEPAPYRLHVLERIADELPQVETYNIFTHTVSDPSMPWAVVINEAVACGLAVITTEVVGAAAELVRHKTNGMIIPPRDVNALADAIRETTDPHVCQWMKNASPEVLRQWRRAADPVNGVKYALRHFDLLTEHE